MWFALGVAYSTGIRTAGFDNPREDQSQRDEQSPWGRLGFDHQEYPDTVQRLASI